VATRIVKYLTAHYLSYIQLWQTAKSAIVINHCDILAVVVHCYTSM